MNHFRSITAGLALALVLAACGGSGAASPGGGCALGGAANDAEFARSFSAMALIDSAGQPGASDPDAGVVFVAGSTIVLSADASVAASIRVCVATRDQAAKVVKDASPAIVVGPNRVELGTFVAGSYVVRIGSGDVLIRNLPFAIR